MKTIEQLREEFPDAYTVQEFIDAINDGWFSSWDGTGFFHDGEKETDICIWDVFGNFRVSEMYKYPYIIWYNK